jgi:hypothetical protein
MISAITAITAILGALSGMVPGILQFFTMKANNAQQLALEQLRLQAAREGTALQIDLANSQSDIEQSKHLYEFAGAPSGVKWVDALTAFIRPYVTIVFLHVWMIEIGALTYYGYSKGMDVKAIAQLVLTPEFWAALAAIIGFWFGNRMLVRGNQQMAATLAVTTATARTPMATKATTAPAPSPHGSAIIPDPPGSRT